MAVSGSDFMQGLNLLLQDRKEDRRFKAQQALTMLQFAQQKKLSEVQIASAGIDIMGKVNKELMSKKASQFISDLGLSGLYYKYKDKNDPLNDAVDELTKESGFFGGKDTYNLKMDKSVASDLVSSIWYHQEGGNSEPLIALGARLHNMGKGQLSGRQQLTYNAFKKLGYISKSGKSPSELLQDFSDMNRLIDNENQILRETDEFLKGDYVIDNINLSRGINKALGELETKQFSKKVAEVKDEDEDKLTDIDTDLTLDEQLDEFDSSIIKSSLEVDKIKGALGDLESKSKDLNFYKESGKELSQDDINFLARVSDMKRLFESDMEKLSEEISETKRMRSTFKDELDRRSSEKIEELMASVPRGSYSAIYP